MPVRFSFLPYARSAIAGALRSPLAGGERLRLAYDLEIQANGAPADGIPRQRIEAPVYGPGDVIGFNPQIISRVEPSSGLRGFEPDYLPFIEFVDADFPWRYSLQTGSGSRLQPWIVLLALRPDEFEFVEQGRAPFPRIRVFSPGTSLPDLSQTWAYAHVQVDLGTSLPADLAAWVDADPGRHFSRLLCPRRLRERSVYHLFLAPAYEAGRLCGIGAAGPAQSFDALSWSPSSAQPVELPLYYQSRFITNAMEDVETMLRRLRGLPAQALGIGAPPSVSAANPGYFPAYSAPGRTFEIQAALKQPNRAVEGFNTDPALAALLSTTLGAVIAGESVTPNSDGPNVDDPLVAMPPYGWRYRNDGAPNLLRAQNGEWYDRLNLDLKLRHAAGLGAETVRRNQEVFMRKCWEQYAEIIAANRLLERLQTAEILTNSLATRRYARLEAGVAVTLSEPLHAYVNVKIGQTLQEAVIRGGTPLSYMSRSVRRVAGKRSLRTSINGRPGTRLIPTPHIPGDRVILGSTGPVGPLSPLAPVDPGAPGDRGFPGGLLDPGRLHIDLTPLARTLFGDNAFRDTAAPQGIPIPVAGFDTRDYQAAIARTLKKLPFNKGQSLVKGRLPGERATLSPVYRSPRLDLPLSEWLRRISTRYILPGAEDLPENTVSMFEENRIFIEAFLAGANHEMNSELRWREFPTDLRGTIFTRFWDRGLPPGNTAGDDIAPLHTWQGPLGGHFSPSAPNRETDMVIVIRADIIRKLDGLILVINRAETNEWVDGRGTNFEPIFSERLGPDVAFYGFDVPRQEILDPGLLARMFLVMYEPAGRLRFGLDVATAAVRQGRRRYDQMTLDFPLAVMGRSYTKIPSRFPGLSTSIPAAPAQWDDFSWSHVRLLASGYIDFQTVIQIPNQDDYWGVGKTSASVARAFWQKPLAAVMPLRRVL